jgi:hypothetical protein
VRFLPLLDHKQLIQDTSIEFVDWIQKYLLKVNERYNKEDIFTDL